jgi:hypothetical protein
LQRHEQARQGGRLRRQFTEKQHARFIGHQQAGKGVDVQVTCKMGMVFDIQPGETQPVAESVVLRDVGKYTPESRQTPHQSAQRQITQMCPASGVGGRLTTRHGRGKESATTAGTAA